jgi:hypothetical protein
METKAVFGFAIIFALLAAGVVGMFISARAPVSDGNGQPTLEKAVMAA